MTKPFTLNASLIDWELLREQKLWLICFEADDGKYDDEDLEHDAEKAVGLLHFIDYIQDTGDAQGVQGVFELTTDR